MGFQNPSSTEFNSSRPAKNQEAIMSTYTYEGKSVSQEYYLERWHKIASDLVTILGPGWVIVGFGGGITVSLRVPSEGPGTHYTDTRTGIRYLELDRLHFSKAGAERLIERFKPFMSKLAAQ
jgi:hypothetical protein